MNAYPPTPPNQVTEAVTLRLRYVPYSFYGFLTGTVTLRLQTPPLTSDILAIRIAFPVDRAATVSSNQELPERSTVRVCQLRWANTKRASRVTLGRLLLRISSGTSPAKRLVRS